MQSRSPQELIDEALDRHRSGELDRAQELYQQVLGLLPDQAQVRHLYASLLQQRGDLPRAEAEFVKVLESDPSLADAHHNLGVIYAQTGRPDDAIKSYGQAISIVPDFAEAHRSLGLLHERLDDSAAAAVAYHHAITADPSQAADYPLLALALCRAGRPEVAVNVMAAHAERFPGRQSVDDLNTRGFALSEYGAHEDAIEFFEQGLAIDPDRAEIHMNLGSVYQQLKRPEESKTHFLRVIELTPDDAAGHHNLGTIERELGSPEAAAICFRRALALDPSLDVSRHQLAMTTGETSERAPDGYIKNLFDRFSQTYDEQLVDQLEYRVPNRILELLEELDPELQTALDLGCGTGLMGEAIEPRVQHLVGVDLSPGMIEKARQKGVYQSLHVAELTEFMNSETAKDRDWDLVVAADVFIYIGDLAPIFQATTPRLSANGVFVFSTEASPDPEYSLTSTGRFLHSRDYIERIANDAGLKVVRVDELTSRIENSQPVPAHLYTLAIQQNAIG